MSNFQSINDEEIEQNELVASVNTINSNIVVINNKMNLTVGSNMKTALDLNTAKTGISSSQASAITANSAKTGISSAQATAINANSLKTTFPGFGTSGGTALEGNTALLALGTSSSTALAGNTALLALGTSSSTALAGDTITISSAQSNAITANSAKTGITTTQSDAITANTSGRTTNATGIATNLTNINAISNNSASSTLKTAVDLNTAKTGITISQTNTINANVSNIATNTTSITNINNAYPKFTNTRRYAYTSGDLYNDGKVKFYWDGVNRQVRFWVLDIPTGDYTVGGVEKWATTNSTRVANYISRNNSTYYHYFTGPQLSGAVLNSSFNLDTNYSKATYFLCAYLENVWPSYEITVLIGYSAGYNTISIKRFN